MLTSLLVLLVVVGAGAATAAFAALRRESARSRDLEAQLLGLCDELPVGVFHADEDGRCTYSNARACELAGLDPHEIVGSGWIAALHPDDRDRVLDRWMAAAASGAVFRAEYRFVKPDGSVRWVVGEVRPRRDAAGLRRGYVGTIVDVTERKRVEKELEHSRVELEQRVADRTAALVHANQQLSREVAVRERVEQALVRGRRTLDQ